MRATFAASLGLPRAGTELTLALDDEPRSDTNWHTMLYLIRLSVALASSTTTSSSSPPSSSDTPAAAPLDHLLRARTLFRHLATEGPKAKVERGYLLGLVELAREAQSHGWDDCATPSPSLPPSPRLVRPAGADGEVPPARR